MMSGRDGERRPTRPVRFSSVTVTGIALAVIVAGLGLTVGDPIVFPVRFAFVVALVAAAAAVVSFRPGEGKRLI